MGIWALADSRIVSLGAKGSSGTECKDSVRGGIFSAVNVSLVQKRYEYR